MTFRSTALSTARRTALLTGLAAVVLAPFGTAWAQDAAAGFPKHAVTLVVPYTPGGPTDLTGRIIGEALSKKWGQPVIIENRPGAGGNIGSAMVAKAAPDGYTLVLGVTGSHAINKWLYKNLPYDPQKDFEPIGMAAIYANAILANPSVPANTLQELIAQLQHRVHRLVRSIAQVVLNALQLVELALAERGLGPVGQHGAFGQAPCQGTTVNLLGQHGLIQVLERARIQVLHQAVFNHLRGHHPRLGHVHHDAAQHQLTMGMQAVSPVPLKQTSRGDRLIPVRRNVVKPVHGAILRESGFRKVPSALLHRPLMTIMQKSGPLEWEELACLTRFGVFLQRGLAGGGFALMLECWA